MVAHLRHLCLILDSSAPSGYFHFGNNHLFLLLSFFKKMFADSWIFYAK